MIPYSTCMRFNQTRRHSLENDNNKFSPCEWTLVQHFGHNTRVESTIINVTSQDDQTLCFTWAIESQNAAQQSILVDNNNALLASSKERSQSDELDRRSVYLLLALRRRKSLQQSIHPETIPLLDPYYYGITQRYLKYSYQWSFNTFSFDVLTSGHSLSSLLLYFFKEYRFIEIFNLDLINVLRCFNYLEKGYHDTNPYHNSVHAADVTQAMHCFLQESKLKQYLTPMEAMCSLLAAVSHDLDHPGVNQQFLIATNSHLTTMHNNLSVLESHHWRFALSCFYESHIFDHFNEKQWKEIKFLLKNLILATDISRQSEFIHQFNNYIKLGNAFSMEKKEHKYFILQIALKCADLGNPCRPWKISQRWSEQICNEFYRQGDFEKLLGLPVTPMCDRNSTTISKTQTDFFKNIVRPLFELWNVFLDSKLTRQLINNLNFNEYMWKNMENVKQSRIKHSHSLISFSDKFEIESTIRCKSYNKLSPLNLSSITLFENTLTKLKASQTVEKSSKPECINGCGTPPSSKEIIMTTTNSEEKVKLNDDVDFDDEEDDFISEFNCGAILSTPALILPNFCYEKPQSGFYRRGSAPGCIDMIRRNELNTAKGTALLLLCNSLKAKNNNNNNNNNIVKRRSSFPNVKIPKGNIHFKTSLQQQPTNISNMTAAMTTRFNTATCINYAKGKSNRNRNNRVFHHQPESCYFGQHHSCRSSLFDISGGNNHGQATVTAANTCHQYLLTTNKQRGGGNQRRRSVPQDIFIRSLNNYTA
ncbi:cAMP-specific 3',5'-cyclic phosphodiesterase 7B [Dermatophagoides farinae]|uniref:Phosphodiesterase n=2 Tax=Dermatophagoides farinae TaxID=6954 RepID=A0A922HZB0_DERFA|nr:cAMP-specific 3',5'-cyclic phosphodiesterase 7B [Dermatophagoides farinae]